MSVITQYLIVIVIYFVAMLGIGILAGRKITNDGDDYFLAKDKLSAAAIGFSFSATQMSGSTYLGTVGTLSTIGYPFVPGALSSAAAPWFCYILLGDRVRRWRPGSRASRWETSLNPAMAKPPAFCPPV